MSVVVYPRLAELLDEHHLTTADLQRRITERFGLAVDPDDLSRLTETAPLHQTDIALAGAVAAALGVGLDDLFTVAALPGQDEAGLDVLDREEGSQLAALLDREGPLNVDEQAELKRLLARYGQLLHERRMQAQARRRGISVEEAERERAEQLAAARAWWDAFDRDPGRDQALAVTAAALRAQWPA